MDTSSPLAGRVACTRVNKSSLLVRRSSLPYLPLLTAVVGRRDCPQILAFLQLIPPRFASLVATISCVIIDAVITAGDQSPLCWEKIADDDDGTAGRQDQCRYCCRCHCRCRSIVVVVVLVFVATVVVVVVALVVVVVAVIADVARSSSSLSLCSSPESSSSSPLSLLLSLSLPMSLDRRRRCPSVRRQSRRRRRPCRCCCPCHCRCRSSSSSLLLSSDHHHHHAWIPFGDHPLRFIVRRSHFCARLS